MFLVLLLWHCRTPELVKQTDTTQSLIGTTTEQIISKNMNFCAGMLDGTAYDRFPQYAISTVSKPSSQCNELYVLLELSHSRTTDGSLNSSVVDALFVDKKYASKSLLTECWESSASNRRAYVIFPDDTQWQNSINLELYDISTAIGVDRPSNKLKLIQDASLKCLNEDFGHE